MADRWEKVPADQVKAGDRVRLSFTQPLTDTEYVITGTAEGAVGGLHLNGWMITDHLADDVIIEVHAPDWRDALVIKSGGCLYGLTNPPAVTRWSLLGRNSERGVHGYHCTDSDLTEIGRPEIIIDANGQVVS